MKNLIAIIIMSIVWALPAQLQAQINEEKMDKDLRVASKVLETLTHGDGDRRFMMYGGNNVEGNYIEGYGVIFSMNGRSMYISQRAVVGYSRGGSGTTVIAPLSDEEKRVKAEAKASAEEKSEDEEIDFEAIMVDFLADYSQLIGQLKPTDKIVVSTKKSDYIFVTSGRAESFEATGASGMSAELLKKDHNDYMAGKISYDQLVKKIKVTIKDDEGSRTKDLDVFGSMLSTVYNESYTDTYFMNWRPEYERIQGVGAIYAFKVYSSYDEGGLHRIPGINKEGLSDEARNENVVNLYPVFVTGMKENMIQYGRTIKSLEEDELLILKITLTKCEGCSIPKKIQFSVKKSVLTSYNAGKTSLKDAIAQVKLSE